MSGSSLPSGLLLGPYRLTAFLGSGGTGDVYRATDTRLSRVVAIKVLRRGGLADEDERRRFRDEARAIAALSHPYVRALFDVGQADGVDFLVMEYVEGQSLAELLLGKPLPVGRALTLATSLGAALAAAHRHGIVHCDIKPGNVMVTPSGVKLLDFGIARLWNDIQGSHAAQATTVSDDFDAAGTRAYMAPERFSGQPCDARGDVFAFGVVVYQMFTGRRPFGPFSGAALIEAMAAGDPLPPSTLNPELPQHLDHLILKCFEREPDLRWQSAADLATELDWVQRTWRPAARRGSEKHVLRGVSGLLAVFVLMLGVRTAQTRQPSLIDPARPIRFLLNLNEDSGISANPGAFEVSPDGTRVAFTASAPGGRRILWLRATNGLQNTPLEGTDDAWSPFWSLDSRRIAFFAGARVRSVDIETGVVTTLGDLPDLPRGVSGSWNSAGDVIMASGGSLLRMSVPGGVVSPIAVSSDDRVRYGNPHFLPDGQRFLFHFKGSSPALDGLYVGNLDPGVPPRKVFDSESQGVFVEPGYVLHMNKGALWAQPVDPETLQLTKDAFELPDQVAFFNTFNQGAFSASHGDLLAYRAGVVASVLRWYDRSGRQLSTVSGPAPYANPSLSPDGGRIAFTRFDPSVGTSDIWIADTRGGVTRLTAESTTEDFPMWSSDGERIMFERYSDGSTELVERPWTADVSSPTRAILADRFNKMPFQWSNARNALLFLSADPEGFLNGDFFVLSPGGEVRPISSLSSGQAVSSGQPQISPDGRWLAYVADITGSPQVFVRRFEGGARWLVSPAGGFEPRWRADGRELFYLAPDGMLMSVPITSASSRFEFTTPRPLFRTRLARAYLGSTFPTGRVRNEYDVSADGQRFLLNEPVDGSAAYAVRVIANWTSVLPKS